MENRGLTILNLNVPCSCACKYCLLRSCKTANGVDYEYGKDIAIAFDNWRKKRALNDFTLSYTIGHCADYDQLSDNISLNKRFDFPGWSFMQINGIGIKNDNKLDEYFTVIKEAGIEFIDTTFFGLSEFHDNFASRKGDFTYLLKIIEYANKYYIKVQPTMPIFENNKEQIGEVINLLNKYISNLKLSIFPHDYWGNGEILEENRLTKSSYEKLPDKIKRSINISRYKTEKEWLENNEWTIYNKRNFTLSLNQDIIKTIEGMTCDKIMKYLIEIDENYYSVVPDIYELSKLCGDHSNEKLYRERDLRWKWQKQYIKEHKIEIQDITDERFCGSLRY
jgi:MoaA/NifB/PqqE/SkfB family radical SAM enzyme